MPVGVCWTWHGFKLSDDNGCLFACLKTKGGQGRRGGQGSEIQKLGLVRDTRWSVMYWMLSQHSAKKSQKGAKTSPKKFKYYSGMVIGEGMNFKCWKKFNPPAPGLSPRLLYWSVSVLEYSQWRIRISVFLCVGSTGNAYQNFQQDKSMIPCVPFSSSIVPYLPDGLQVLQYNCTTSHEEHRDLYCTSSVETRRLQNNGDALTVLHSVYRNPRPTFWMSPLFETPRSRLKSPLSVARVKL